MLCFSRMYRTKPWTLGSKSSNLNPALNPTLSTSQILLPTTVPHSAELCGLQSILPRQSGVRVLDKIGEGTFAKVVLAVNHRNPARYCAKP